LTPEAKWRKFEPGERSTEFRATSDRSGKAPDCHGDRLLRRLERKTNWCSTCQPKNHICIWFWNCIWGS